MKDEEMFELAKFIERLRDPHYVLTLMLAGKIAVPNPDVLANRFPEALGPDRPREWWLDFSTGHYMPSREHLKPGMFAHVREVLTR